jgi:NADH/F420H2 dehydrogenase subunit C
MSDTDARENVLEPPGDAGPEVAADVDEVAAAVMARVDGCTFHRSHGQAVLYAPRAALGEIARFLRDEQQFTTCIDVTAVDHLLDGVRHCPDGVEPERFEVVASFLSHARNRRLRVVCEVPEEDPTVPTVCDTYPGTNHAEREVYDMFGIVFDGHPDLTRILMPDDWDGHPLRKDHPPARVPVTFKGDPTPR